MRHSVEVTFLVSLARFIVVASMVGAAGCQSSGHDNSQETIPTPPTTTDSTPTTTIGAWATYHDPSGVSFVKPATWTVVPGQEGPLVVYMDPATGVPFRRNINILHQLEPQPLTLSQYTAVTKQELEAVSDFVQTSLGPVTFDGHPGMRQVYSATLPGLPSRLEFLSQWTVIGGKPWLVTYTSDPSRFSALVPSALRLIDSMTLPVA